MGIGGQVFLESLRYGFDDLRPYPGLTEHWHLLDQCVAEFTLVLLNGSNDTVCLLVRHFDHLFERLASAPVIAQTARLLAHLFSQSAFDDVGQVDDMWT